MMGGRLRRRRRRHGSLVAQKLEPTSGRRWELHRHPRGGGGAQKCETKDVWKKFENAIWSVLESEQGTGWSGKRHFLRKCFSEACTHVHMYNSLDLIILRRYWSSNSACSISKLPDLARRSRFVISERLMLTSRALI